MIRLGFARKCPWLLALIAVAAWGRTASAEDAPKETPESPPPAEAASPQPEEHPREQAWAHKMDRPKSGAEAAATSNAAEKTPVLQPGDEPAGFHFGSYGRMRAATDLRGGGPQTANFVAHGSRLELAPYLELELRRTDYVDDVRVRVISTVAMAGDPFHYTGRFETTTAVRNMFVDVRGIGSPGLTLWAGARMYRGDDAYLLDFWPLDNLNTVGGGAIFDATNSTRIALHAGANRLLDGQFQYQEQALPSRSHFGSDTAVTLDRPRTIASAKITQYFPNNREAKGAKITLYGEAHYLPSGEFNPSASNTVVPAVQLPSDTGFVIGAQGTAFGFGDRDGHVHLWARYARGLAAYGDLAVPFGLDRERRSSKASEFLLATSGNYEAGPFGAMLAAYVRNFRDASSAQYSRNQYWEGIFAVRPIVYTSKHTGLGGEVSYQYKSVNVLNDDGTHTTPQAWRFSVLPLLTPYGWGSFRRPIIHAVYTATMRNRAAQEYYPADDPRASRAVEHYFGLHAEWWFNSSSYP